VPIVKLDYRNVLTLGAGPTGRTRYTDEVLPGFALRVSASGARMFYAVYRAGAKVRMVKVGDARLLEIGEARKKAKAILGKVADGKDPAAEKAAKRKTQRLGAHTLDALARRLILAADIAESTRGLWLHTLTKHISPKLGTRAPGTVTRGDVRDLLAGIPSRAVAKNARRVVAWIYARAVEEDTVGASPCVGLGRPLKEVPRDRVLTHAEIRAVWVASGAAGAYGAAVRLALLTAARREEIFSATWGELDREAKVWRIAAARAKNRRAHDVPLSEAAFDVIDGLEADDEDRRLFRRRPTSKAWRDLLKVAGIINAPEEEDEESDKPKARKVWTPMPIRFHDIRRTVRNALTHDLGVSVAVAEDIVGHRPPPLVVTYAPDGVALRDVRAALDRWATELHAIVSGKRAPKVRPMPSRT
jgi:integrase